MMVLVHRLAAALIASFVLITQAQAADGVQKIVTFDTPSPLSSAAEIARRAFSPLRARRLAAANNLNGQPVDITKESFILYVPAQKPPQGYTLLVFVPPWDEAKLPDGWSSVLDENGVIFVSAAHSGNDTSVHNRRMPLALIAAQNVARQYGVDPAHIYVGGFSGGSRVALRLALAYPDVFHGALLNSGSDPIGTPDVTLPPADLMQRFQQSTRLVYLTGDQDSPRQGMTNASMRSMRAWCVSDVHIVTMMQTGHEAANASAFSEALATLLGPAPPKIDDLASCRAGLESELDGKLHQVDALITAGDKSGARQALDDLDATFGGLAAPRSLALDDALR
jgi:pimeloyl-ACP methyl ester carboxylesterase